MSNPFSIYGSHDSNICFRTGQNDFVTWELERLTKKRNYILYSDENFRDIVTQVRDLIKLYYDLEDWGTCYWAELSPDQKEILKEVFGFDHMEFMSHHSAHAAGSLYQSPFEEALIVSSDGGGYEIDENKPATFCIFHGKKNGAIEKIATIPLDACGAYTLIAVSIADIRKEDIWTDYLRYAGKLMGLCAYGNIRPAWFEAMREYFYLPVRMESLQQLGERIGLDLSDINTITGQDAYDLAATAQYVFEQVTITAVLPFAKRYQLPIIHTGGSGLNVILNERLRKEIGYPVFVPCNPNDCGLSFGFMVLRNPPDQQVNIQYNNFPILYIEQLGEYVEKYNARLTNFKEIARLLCRGKIVGIMRGLSEAGPRALGNRSILCWTRDNEMKDKLNSKVKFREWFRPYAPVVKSEDVDKYFEFNGESPFMSFAPKVKVDARLLLPAITHADGTARLQTVTKEQNEFLYNLIDAVETIDGYGVLLNTSLNTKGNPIMTTVSDAIELWQSTELDAIVINDYLFIK